MESEEPVLMMELDTKIFQIFSDFMLRLAWNPMQLNGCYFKYNISLLFLFWLPIEIYLKLVQNYCDIPIEEL